MPTIGLKHPHRQVMLSSQSDIHAEGSGSAIARSGRGTSWTTIRHMTCSWSGLASSAECDSADTQLAEAVCSPSSTFFVLALASSKQRS